MKEHFQQKLKNVVETRNTSPTIPPCAYISDAFKPKLMRGMKGNVFVVERRNVRQMKRLVSAEKLYGAANRRFDAVLVTMEKYKESHLNIEKPNVVVLQEFVDLFVLKTIPQLCFQVSSSEKNYRFCTRNSDLEL